MSQKHQLHKCTETPQRRAAELIHYPIRGIYNAKMPTNQCVECRQLATRALFTLEPLALNPTDTSWSAFSYYIDHVQVQTPHIAINHGPHNYTAYASHFRSRLDNDRPQRESTAGVSTRTKINEDTPITMATGSKLLHVHPTD